MRHFQIQHSIRPNPNYWPKDYQDFRLSVWRKQSSRYLILNKVNSNFKRLLDGVFIVGNGSTVELGKSRKVPIRGKDTENKYLLNIRFRIIFCNSSVESMTEKYDGSRDIILDLPTGIDVYNIDWLAVDWIYLFITKTGILGLLHQISSELCKRLDQGYPDDYTTSCCTIRASMKNILLQND